MKYDSTDLKQHPAYREAVAKIVALFHESGYGTIILDELFDLYLSIKQPTEKVNYEQYKALELERLQRYKAIEDLLVQHNICLVRSKAVAGFEILPPRDQIKVAYDKFFDRMRRTLTKVTKVLSHVDRNQLTAAEENERQGKLVRAAFIKGAMNKRKIEEYKPKPQKSLGMP